MSAQQFVVSNDHVQFSFCCFDCFFLILTLIRSHMSQESLLCLCGLVATNDSRKNVFINLELVRLSIYQFVVRMSIQVSEFCFVFQSDAPFFFLVFPSKYPLCMNTDQVFTGMCGVHLLWSSPSMATMSSRVEPSAILTHIPKDCLFYQ